MSTKNKKFITSLFSDKEGDKITSCFGSISDAQTVHVEAETVFQRVRVKNLQTGEDETIQIPRGRERVPKGYRRVYRAS